MNEEKVWEDTVFYLKSEIIQEQEEIKALKEETGKLKYDVEVLSLDLERLKEERDRYLSISLRQEQYILELTLKNKELAKIIKTFREEEESEPA